jgi:hypothetical protein
MRQREKLSEIWYDELNVTNIPVIFIYGPADPIKPAQIISSKAFVRYQRHRIKSFA